MSSQSSYSFFVAFQQSLDEICRYSLSTKTIHHLYAQIRTYARVYTNGIHIILHPRRYFSSVSCRPFRSHPTDES